MSTPAHSFTPPPVVECANAPDRCASFGKKVHSSTKLCRPCVYRNDTQRSRASNSSSPEAPSNVEPQPPKRRVRSEHSEPTRKTPSFICAFRDPHFDNHAIFPWRGEPSYQPPKSEPCRPVSVQGGLCTNCLARINAHWRSLPQEEEALKQQLSKFFRLGMIDDLHCATHKKVACPFNTEQCSGNLITFVGEDRWPCWNCLHDHPDRLEKDANADPNLLYYVRVVRSHLQGRARLERPYVCLSQDPNYMAEPWRRKSWRFRIPHFVGAQCLLYTRQQSTLCPVCRKMANLQGSDINSKPDRWYEEVFDTATGKKKR